MQFPEGEATSNREVETSFNRMINRLNHLIHVVSKDTQAPNVHHLISEVDELIKPMRTQEAFLMHWNYTYFGMAGAEPGKLIARIHSTTMYHDAYPEAGPCLLLRPVDPKLRDFYTRQYHQLDVWPIPEAMTLPIASMVTPILLMGRPFYTYASNA